MAQIRFPITADINAPKTAIPVSIEGVSDAEAISLGSRPANVSLATPLVALLKLAVGVES